MEIKIDGNPGTGNNFTQVNIGTVQNYNPNATTVINNNYGFRVKTGNTQTQDADSGVDKEVIGPMIVGYVRKTLCYVSDGWKNRFESLWHDILNLREVDTEVYKQGFQQGTQFNRVLVAGIIHVLKDNGVYVKCSNTALAVALEGNEEHHVRQEIGRYPSEPVQTAVNNLLHTRKYR